MAPIFFRNMFLPPGNMLWICFYCSAVNQLFESILMLKLKIEAEVTLKFLDQFFTVKETYIQPPLLMIETVSPVLKKNH